MQRSHKEPNRIPIHILRTPYLQRQGGRTAKDMVFELCGRCYMTPYGFEGKQKGQWKDKPAPPNQPKATTFFGGRLS